MKIRVDFYKDTGKWYEGGIVDIGDTPGWNTDAVKQAIVNHQNIMGDNWGRDYYYVVVDNVDDNDDFCKRLFPQGAFRGIAREEL